MEGGKWWVSRTWEMAMGSRKGTELTIERRIWIEFLFGKRGKEW